MKSILAGISICILFSCTTAPQPDEAAIKKAERMQRENTRNFLESRHRQIKERIRQAPDSVYLRSIDSFITKNLDSINRLPPL